MRKEIKRFKDILGGSIVLSSYVTGTTMPPADDWGRKSIASVERAASDAYDYVQSEKQRQSTTDALKDATRARNMPSVSRTVKRPDVSRGTKGIKDIR